MFKKLFGKKRSKKPESFQEAKEWLIESISEESSHKHLPKNLEFCFEYLIDADKEVVDEFANDVFKLIETLPIAQSSLAMSVCANIVTRGYDNEQFVDDIMSIYNKSLEGSMPFFILLDREVKKGEEGDLESDIDVDSLYHELLKDRNSVSEKVGEFVTRVELYSRHIIAILSMRSSWIDKYKSELKDNIFIVKDYNQACYWLFRLFEVLFDEPILVIDIDNHVGFEGKMNGVSDNFQLQHLLMGMPELNEVLAISENDLMVVNGNGIHVSNSVVVGKWNMYNREIVDQEDWLDIKVGPAKTMELQDFWIWGEGTPSEISVHNNRRVILLGRPSVKRSTRVQRIFENMKASIEVEKVLTDEEINTCLGL